MLAAWLFSYSSSWLLQLILACWNTLLDLIWLFILNCPLNAVEFLSTAPLLHGIRHVLTFLPESHYFYGTASLLWLMTNRTGQDRSLHRFHNPIPTFQNADSLSSPVSQTTLLDGSPALEGQELQQKKNVYIIHLWSAMLTLSFPVPLLQWVIHVSRYMGDMTETLSGFIYVRSYLLRNWGCLSELSLHYPSWSWDSIPIPALSI